MRDKLNLKSQEQRLNSVENAVLEMRRTVSPALVVRD